MKMRTCMESKITEDELTALILEYQSSMYRIALSILKNPIQAQDAVGETIVRAYEQRERLKKKASAKAWITQILVNESRKIIKKQRRFVPYDDEYVDERIVEKQDDREVWEYVCSLAQPYREVTLLYYLEWFSVQEISTILGLPQGTIKSRLKRSRDKLSEIMKQDGYGYE